MSFLGLIGSIGGSLLSGGLGLLGQNSANKQMERMSNTAYQRASTDMMAAGLNPAAMFGSGGPAGTPSIQNAMASPAAAAGQAAGSASAMLIANKTIDKMTEEIAKTRAEANIVKAQLAGVAGDSAVKGKVSDAVLKIPDKVFTPLVQAGFGADTMKATGKLGAAGGAGVASAKGVLEGAQDAFRDFAPSMSGPSVGSALAALRFKGDQAVAGGKAWLWNEFEKMKRGEDNALFYVKRKGPPPKGSTIYKNDF